MGFHVTLPLVSSSHISPAIIFRPGWPWLVAPASSPQTFMSPNTHPRESSVTQGKQNPGVVHSSMGNATFSTIRFPRSSNSTPRGGSLFLSLVNSPRESQHKSDYLTDPFPSRCAHTHAGSREFSFLPPPAMPLSAICWEHPASPSFFHSDRLQLCPARQPTCLEG